ncbi:DNA mismatch repair endonuclease MutL [Bombilactobacillus thymidiniphilus]|uniref:DNA mismatch repair protein MutL n=1 Tax=Bombilactobacillus thymidiniphilus TaxID=2923363 RepID=A0ABY4PDQ9_9LACO|nr:DNA mismatch repair endonuclease MutL [Bombilactobacillus thymidiniphilus]UQS83908.1 DNA mismatch repair endonuclease MutL [Bombilactobacillus thymidiniphilus]
MGTIQKLSPLLSNKIAAGEVIERPASVVKELVENAIDAKASQVDIMVKDAGISQITVMDNGTGIAANEVELAFQPHTTSKIKKAVDLFNVRTLGFRGEALASIAAIAKVQLITSTDGAIGTKLQLAGGEKKNLQTVSASQGSAITVQDLFYNTPARLKYLKTVNTELNQVINIVNRIALGNPSVAFNLINENKTLIKTSGNGNLQQTIAGIYGRPTAQNLVAVQGQDNDFMIDGYISLPQQTRSSRNYISLLVNGRYIVNQQLTKAVLAGFGSKLMVGRYPIGVLNIKMDPLLVDVNVHPTKREVRFSKEEQLATLIKTTIAENLNDINLIPSAVNSAGPLKFSPSASSTLTTQIKEPTTKQLAPTPDQWIKPGAINPQPIFDDPEHLASWDQNIKQKASDKLLDPAWTELAANVNHQGFPQLQFLTQIHATYLVAQSNDGFYLVDQHAAQERVNYEKYRQEVGQVSADQQKLLVPLILNYPNADTVIINDHLDMLQSVGIQIAPFGQNSFVVTSHPTWIKIAQEEQTIREVIDYVLQDGKISIAEFREQTAITMSCKLAIKAHDVLDNKQAQAILDQLAQTQNPYNCPHGRPTLVHFSEQDIQKMFKRIQDAHQPRREK